MQAKTVTRHGTVVEVEFVDENGTPVGVMVHICQNLMSAMIVEDECRRTVNEFNRVMSAAWN